MSVESDDKSRSPKLPSGLRHVAIIMDGNGRWANMRGLRRTRGHKEGAGTVRRITTTCAELGLEQLTLYALSVENWARRPKLEIDYLLALLKRFLAKERATIMDNDIRFKVIGRTQEFPKSVRREIESLEEVSRGNEGMVLCLALNYGGRSEIADACRVLAEEVARGERAADSIDEAAIESRLYDPVMPPVDLMVRTAGEMRISNFLLWQVSYGELFVCDTTWPDFDEGDLGAAFEAYGRRKRKFGGLAQPVDA